MRLMRSRRFTSNSTGRKGNLQGATRERACVKCVRHPNCVSLTHVVGRKLWSRMGGQMTSFPMISEDVQQQGYPGTNVVTFEEHI